MNQRNIRTQSILLYAAMVTVALIFFFLIHLLGESFFTPTSVTTSQPPAIEAKTDPLIAVLIALTAVVVAGRLLALLLGRLGQPPVIGEVLGGILLGPSALGHLWPEASSFLLPPSSAPYLGVIAQIGVILYMFLIGLELNPAGFGRSAAVVVGISHAGIAIPFVLGAALSLILYPGYAPRGVPFGSFSLFVGVALSITAFPVLARLLADLRMHKSPLGVLALGCAAAGDATAWCVLAVVVGVVQSKVGGALAVVALTALYLAVMFVIVRPLAARFAYQFDEERLNHSTLAIAFAALLLSALATELIGIHAIFGAFLLGAIVPHDSPIAEALTRRLEGFVSVLLLPAFFAYTGLRTEIALVSDIHHWLLCALIIAVATLGKFGGTLVAARLSGMNWRESSALGVLMNTRGLVELIVLNVGLDLGVLSPTLFAIMVLMALSTTVATAPMVQMILPRQSHAKLNSDIMQPIQPAQPA